MNLFPCSYALLWLLHVSPVNAQALTLDQLFWLRERPEGDNMEYLGEQGWKFVKYTTNDDSLYYSTTWIFQNAYKKRLAELVYASRGAANVVSITYSTSNGEVFKAIKARVAAYHMRCVGQQLNKGIAWTYFRYEDDYDVGLGVYTNPRAAYASWYTVFVRPRWR